MTGHRPSYLRRIINTSLTNNYRVIVAMPTSCFEHQVVKELFGKHNPSQLSGIRCDVMSKITEPKNQLLMLLNQYRCARFYRTALTEAQAKEKIDLIFIGMLEDAAIFSGITGLSFGGIPLLGIVMRQQFHFSQMGAIGPSVSKQGNFKKAVFLRLLKRSSAKTIILTIDTLLLNYITTHHPDICHSLAHIPDAVDDRVSVTNPNVRKDLGIPSNAFVIMAYGALRENKGIDLLVDAMDKLPERVHVLLVGNQNSEIRSYLEEKHSQKHIASGRIHQVNRYIDVTEDANFFTCADLIWVGYKNYYAMSAVLVQAAQYRRPVLATDVGLIGWLTNKHKTGLAINISKQDEIVKSINHIALQIFEPDNNQYDALVEEHSLAAFENALLPCYEKLID